ncbi:MAG TPA: hypothetical protein VHV75_00615 [Solirubrobacteraceae bacterium]|nr:hypothetical protein [Solirubrobacteraceae bacterium]
MASKQTVITRPVARSERVLVETVGNETVIYDQDTQVAHALKPLAAAVHMYANGDNTAAEIAELASYRLETPVTEAEVAEAITQLSELNLLDTPELGRNGFSRRDALKVFGAVGAGTVLVSSVAAPFASADLTGNGAPYLCGTGINAIKDASGYSTVYNSSKGQGWPQPYSNSNGTWVSAGQAGGPTTGSSSHNLGSPCVVTPNKGYDYCRADGLAISDTYVNNATQCQTTGFFVDSGGNWAVNSSSAMSPGTQACAFNVGSTTYYDTSNTALSDCNLSSGFCVDSSNKVKGPASGGSCSHSETYVPNSQAETVTWTTGVWGDGEIDGTYQVIPCDGNYVGASYQCSEVVCVPAGVSVAGAIVSGSILSEAGDSHNDGGGYSPYTVSACALWGTNYNGTNFCTDYPYKWCTNNPCVKTGTCKS